MWDCKRDVAVIDVQTQLELLMYKRFWPVSARDFLVVKHWRVEEDGSIIFLTFAPPGDQDRPDCPKQSDFVRGAVQLAGWIVSPHGAPAAVATQSKCVYIASVDLGGSISSSIVNTLSSKQPLRVAIMNEVVLKRKVQLYGAGEGQRHALRNGEPAAPTAEEEAILLGLSHKTKFDEPKAKAGLAPVPASSPSSRAEGQVTEDAAAAKTGYEVGRVGKPPQYADMIESKLNALKAAARSKHGENKWSLVKRKDGVEIWSQDTSPLVTTKGVGIVRAPPRAILDVLLSPDNNTMK